MNIKSLLACVLSCLAVSCSTFVGPETPKANGPKNRPTLGSVAYNPDGIKELVNQRRASALGKIVEYCGSNDYVILKEENRAKSSEGDSIATFGASTLRYIDFECNQKPAGA